MDCCHHFDWEVGLLIYPGLGVVLSCFGHDRAKNNSMLSGGLELCSSLVWDYPWLSFPSSQGCEGIGVLRYAVVGLQTVLAWPFVEGLVNPVVLV